MQPLSFNKETHTYKNEATQQIVPNVTSIISELVDFSQIKKDVLYRAAEFGKAVHKACELDDLDNLKRSTLDAALLPYLRAWRSWSKQINAKWKHIEYQLHHDRMGYAGTADRIGIVGGKMSIVDIKTTATLMPYTAIQLAAYEYAFKHMTDETMPIQRIAVQLLNDGRFRTKIYDSPLDKPAFIGLIAKRNWMKQNQLKFKEYHFHLTQDKVLNG